jgi:hypothetical protein
MVEWTEDNFGNEGARDYLSMMTSKLVATMKEVMGDDERLRPEEDGESLLMPSLAILAMLCESCGASPPRQSVVKQWHEKYLAAFDAGFAGTNPPPDLMPDRRRVIENTFRWLESLAESYYET